MLPFILTAACAASLSSRRRARLPLGERLLRVSPAVTSSPGQTPTQEDRAFCEGKTSAVGPISARIWWADSTPPDPGPRPIVPLLPHGAVAVERSPAPIRASVVPGIATASTPSSTAGDGPATDEHRLLRLRVTVPGWRVVSHRRAPPRRGGPWRLRPPLRACAARSRPTDPKRRTTT